MSGQQLTVLYTNTYYSLNRAVLALFRGFQHLNRAVTALLAYEATTRDKAVKMSWHGIASYRPHLYVSTQDLLFAEKSEMLHGGMHLSDSRAALSQGKKGVRILLKYPKKIRSEFQLLPFPMDFFLRFKHVFFFCLSPVCDLIFELV